MSVHIEAKSLVAIEGFADKGAKIFLTTCNPKTTTEDSIDYIKKNLPNVVCYATTEMSMDEYKRGIQEAIEWKPTHLCEMGSDLTWHIHQYNLTTGVKCALEATSSGISRIHEIEQTMGGLKFPVFDWDSIPSKKIIHNRFMVGLGAFSAFMQRSRISFHKKNVLIVGFGQVGQGCATNARNFGGHVTIFDVSYEALLLAKFEGWTISSDLADAFSKADIIVTATGSPNIVTVETIKNIKGGCHIINVGHFAQEIDVENIYQKYQHETMIPFVEKISVGEKSVFMFADGTMANLTAGIGDSLNAFDSTLAIMVEGVKFMTEHGANWEKKLHLVPSFVREELCKNTLEYSNK